MTLHKIKFSIAHFLSANKQYLVSIFIIYNKCCLGMSLILEKQFSTQLWINQFGKTR